MAMAYRTSRTRQCRNAVRIFRAPAAKPFVYLASSVQVVVTGRCQTGFEEPWGIRWASCVLLEIQEPSVATGGNRGFVQDRIDRKTPADTLCHRVNPIKLRNITQAEVHGGEVASVSWCPAQHPMYVLRRAPHRLSHGKLRTRLLLRQTLFDCDQREGSPANNVILSGVICRLCVCRQ